MMVNSNNSLQNANAGYPLQIETLIPGKMASNQGRQQINYSTNVNTPLNHQRRVVKGHNKAFSMNQTGRGVNYNEGISIPGGY
jgi:hypothetical protein